MAAELIFIFSYDIADNRTRREIADVLEQHGVRVQYSVFEVRCTAERAERLLDRLAALRGAGDSLRMYCLTEEGRARSATRGGAPIPERQEFWVL